MLLLAIPDMKCTTVVAEIAVDLQSQRLSAKFPEVHERFREIVKAADLSYVRGSSWWVRKITERSAPLEHRAAELGRALLVNGFPVQFPNVAIRDLALTGDIQPECRRWILRRVSGEYKDWFVLEWGWGEPDFYQRARQFITGNRYDADAHRVVAPIDAYEEVADFAAMHGFRFSPSAQALLDEARARYAEGVLVTLRPETPRPPDDLRRPMLAAVAANIPERHLDYQRLDFRTTKPLLAHQVPAVAHLQNVRVGAFFLDMGLGKTRCAIELAAQRQGRLSNVVWFCPVSLKLTVAEEIRKHTDTPENRLYIFDDKTTIAALPQAWWYIIGLESLGNSDRVTLAANHLIDENSMVVVDESSYIKGHASKRTRRVTQMAERARYRLLLTGTPLSQGVEDLFSQMRFLSPEILGYTSFYSFSANHLEYHPDYPDMVVRAHNTDFLAAKVAPYVYQVTKEEALTLPEKRYDRIYFDLSSEQREAYQRAKWEILLGVEEVDSYVIFKLFGALQQIVSGFWQHKRGREEFENWRMGWLFYTLAGIPEREKVIIWCKYVYSLERISEQIAAQHGADAVAVYYGKLSEHERAAELEQWRGDGCRYLVATLATGGHGLTLNEAAYAVFYENGFKYSERAQAEDRIHRIGQERPVTYIDLLAKCGIEERIAAALDRKEDVVRAFRSDVRRMRIKAHDLREGNLL